jgi:hypothetical protein
MRFCFHKLPSGPTLDISLKLSAKEDLMIFSDFTTCTAPVSSHINLPQGILLFDDRSESTTRLSVATDPNGRRQPILLLPAQPASLQGGDGS